MQKCCDAGRAENGKGSEDKEQPDRDRLGNRNFMPSGLSSSEAAILANQIGTELKIDNIWSVFGNYWGPNPNSMRAAYNRGMDQKKTIPFLEK